MTIDEELLAQMKLTEEGPDDPRKRRVATQKFAKSKYNVDELRERVGDRVMVKCISECEPWANDQPMKHWEDYFVTVEDAVLLDERRFAVILLTDAEPEEDEEDDKPVVVPKVEPQKFSTRPPKQSKSNRR